MVENVTEKEVKDCNLYAVNVNGYSIFGVLYNNCSTSYDGLTHPLIAEDKSVIAECNARVKLK